ncbi:MAG: glycosyltransferase family 4 protein [Kiritimatiellae bacterium]|nr:glycosyltransferase family 4 protein [Kiritimatiellia bacterium]
MRVCLDIQAAIAQRAGVGRYVACLATHLAREQPPDAHLRFFCFDFRGRARCPTPAGTSLRRLRWLPGRVVQKAWSWLRWPPFDWLAGAADVFHFPNFLRPPLHRGRSVVTIHDLSFLRHPETTEERNLRHLRAHIQQTVARADAILTDSHTIADEIRQQWPAAAPRVVAVPLAAPEGFARPPDEAIARARAARGLDRPYLLSVGTLEPRKNYAFLVEVFEHLADFDGDLVLAGRPGWKWAATAARIAASPRAARIRHLEPADDAEICALYAGAEAFVCASLYEGFGFPPLEAMACGTPVVVSAGGSLPEVCGDGALIVPGFEADVWAASIRRVLSDRQLRAALVERGHRNLARYSWAQTARQTWAVYRAVAEGHR